MAVDWRTETSVDAYGSIEALTLKVLHEELDKLRGTLAEDRTLNYDKCLVIADEFIDGLGQCLNLSMTTYPEDKDIYNHVFDGLQDVIDLTHGAKEGLTGSDGNPRLMDHDEARITASDRVVEIMDELNHEMMKRQATRLETPGTALTQSEAVEAIKKRNKKE